jgi:prolipoprotein diacylglyceryltransferase
VKVAGLPGNNVHPVCISQTGDMQRPRRRNVIFSPAMNSILNAFANRTVLYRSGNVIVLTFGVMFGVAAALWMTTTGACLITRGLTLRETCAFMIGATISALFFSHLFWRLGQLQALLHLPPRGLRRTGFVSWGGLAGLCIFSVLFCSLRNYPLLMISDDVLRGMFAAYAVGRLGCLTYGCCYGTASHRGGIRYWSPDAKVIREKGGGCGPRHATQLFSCAQGVFLFCLLNALPFFKVSGGLITTVAFLAYPLSRAYIEAYRDRKRYFRLFTSGHFACLGAFLVGCLLAFGVSESAGGPAPVQLSSGSLIPVLWLAPVIVPTSVIVFGATGLHWKRVGSW